MSVEAPAAKSGRPSIAFVKGAVKGAAIGTAVFGIAPAAEAAITTEGGLEEKAAAAAPILADTAKGMAAFTGAAAGVKYGGKAVAAGAKKWAPSLAARAAGSGAAKAGGRFLASRALGVAAGPVGWAAMAAPTVIQAGQGIARHYGYTGPTVKFGGPLGMVPTGIEHGSGAGPRTVVDTARDSNTGRRTPRRSLRLR
jgi:hypothetical protein